MKGMKAMKKFRKIICAAAAAAMISVPAGALAYEYPSWSARDENGNAMMRVQNADGTWTELPSWAEAYAALDYDSDPEHVKEMILTARACLILEAAGIDTSGLYAGYLGAEFDPELQ